MNKMKHLLFWAVVAALAMTFGACKRGATSTTATAGTSESASITKQDMVMEPFDELTLVSDADVVIEPGEEQHVIVEAPARVMPYVNVYVEDQDLHIDAREMPKGMKMDSVTVRVITSVIKNLELKGAGNISASQLLVAHDIDIHLSGAGNVTLDGLTCNKLDIDLSGAGNISISNLQAAVAETELSGAGKVVLKGHAGQHAEHVGGAGTIDTSQLK